MRRRSVAEEYLQLTEAWNNASKKTIIQNVSEHLCNQYPECAHFTNMQKKLAEITKSKMHATYAWLNMGRENVKIPLLKLCMVAMTLNVDIYELLKENVEENVYEEICNWPDQG